MVGMPHHALEQVGEVCGVVFSQSEEECAWHSPNSHGGVRSLDVGVNARFEEQCRETAKAHFQTDL